MSLCFLGGVAIVSTTFLTPAIVSSIRCLVGVTGGTAGGASFFGGGAAFWGFFLVFCLDFAFPVAVSLDGAVAVDSAWVGEAAVVVVGGAGGVVVGGGTAGGGGAVLTTSWRAILVGGSS